MLLALAIITTSATSCNKETEEDTTTTTTTDDTDATDDDTDNTDEEEETVDTKEALEQTGIDVVKQLSAFSKLDIIDYAIQFGELSDVNSPFDFGNRSSRSYNFGSLFKSIELVGANKISFTGFMNALYHDVPGSNRADSLGNPETAQEAFDSIKGTYTWQSDSTWIKTTGSDLVLLFPASETEASNNATITITYEGEMSSDSAPWADEYDGDLPKHVTITLAVDGATELAYDFETNYDADMLPTDGSMTLTITPFIFAGSASKTDAKVALDYSIKNGTTTILAMHGDGNGDFSKASIDATIEEIENTDGLEESPVTTANAYFQVFNIKMNGTIDVANLYTASMDLDDDTTDTDKAEVEGAISNINEHISLDVTYADTEDKIADLEAYLVERDNEYTDWVWNEDSMDYVETLVSEIEYNVEFRFIFPDGSKSDMETYFGDGDEFGDLETEINLFIQELNDRYDLDIDPVDFDG